MDLLINFLGATPYQAIAIPALTGVASGPPPPPFNPNPTYLAGYFSNSSSARKEWYPTLRKPHCHPPNWLFAPTWMTLYGAMGYTSHLIARTAMETLSQPKYLLARAALGIYVVQLGVNALWTPLFFGKRNPRAALLDIGLLGGLVGSMTWLFGLVDEVAGAVCVPYVCWVGFATYLNYEIVKLNPAGRDA
jgi:translocator protein